MMQKHKASSSLGRVQNLTHYLTNSKVQEPNLTVDDELCAPRQQNIFLTASMIFLQNHLNQKLKGEDLDSVRFKSESAIKTRSSSDLLIIEKYCKHKSKKYLIRLKDIERYDEILRREACIPPKALSLENILPLPKRHSVILQFFKTISSSNLPQISLLNKSNVIFRFKKSEISSKSKIETPPSEIDNFTNLNERCQKYIDQLPSENSLMPIDYTSTLANTKSSLDILTLKCNNSQAASVIYKMSLFRDSFRCINEISGDSFLKRGVSEDVNYKTKVEIKNCDITDKHNLLKKSETNLLTRCSAQTELIKRQQSKLSVCDDYDWSYAD